MTDNDIDELVDELVTKATEDDDPAAYHLAERVARMSSEDWRHTYIQTVQAEAEEWRQENVPSATPMSQIAHTRNELAELSDFVVKTETYDDDWMPDETEVKREAGDVLVAYVGVLSLMDLDPVECIEAALSKNDDRDWSAWKEDGA